MAIVVSQHRFLARAIGSTQGALSGSPNDQVITAFSIRAPFYPFKQVRLVYEVIGNGTYNGRCRFFWKATTTGVLSGSQPNGVGIAVGDREPGVEVGGNGGGWQSVIGVWDTGWLDIRDEVRNSRNWSTGLDSYGCPIWIGLWVYCPNTPAATMDTRGGQLLFRR